MRVRPPSVLVVFAALLAGRAAAQDPGVSIPDSLWTSCPADGLPRHLLRLSTGRADAAARDASARALAALGPRAHRWLLGGMRLPPTLALHGVAPAFGDFGPASAWAMPALLESLAVRSGDRTTLALLERLGSTAKPAVAPLRRNGSPEAKALADRIDALPDAVPTFAPMPSVAPVDAAWREALLAVLRDPAQVARWWPALQALLGIDELASIAAAEVLLLHAAESDGELATCVRELLFALRCYHAADALRSLDAALALPAPHRDPALRRALLASCPPLNLRGPSPRPDAQRVLAFAASASPAERRLAALSAAMHSVLAPFREVHRYDALAALLADGDATTRELAAVAARSSDALVEERFAESPDSRVAWVQFADWEPEYLRRVPRARLAQALNVLAQAGGTRPRSDTGGVAEQLLRTTDPPRDTSGARELLAAVAAKAPELLAPFTDGDEPTRRALAQVLASTTSMPPAMCEWWLDQQTPKVDDRAIGDHLPLATAPALLGRLRRGERLEHTLALLHTTRAYLDWHETMDRDSDAFAAIVSRVPASHLQAFANLLTWGAQRRRVAEQLLLAPDTAAALRPLLLRGLKGGNEQYPPSDAFVLACLKSPDYELAMHGASIAGRAGGSRDAVVALLLERLPAADENVRRGIVRSLGQLGSPAAHAVLREQLHRGSAVLQRDAAIALASAAEPDAEAMAWLRAGIASDDVEHRRQVWRWISFSEEVAPLFLDEALERLTAGGDVQNSLRLRSLLSTVAKTRRDEVLRVVARLTRHADDEIANFAEDLLQQLSAK